MIDLHLHTTASDGRSTPQALVAESRAAGLTTIAVTDHDTTAAVAEVRGAAEADGLTCVTGIEMTAVSDGRDIHVLGYFIDEAHGGLAAFLETQRADRRRRVVEIGERLATLGVAIDVARVLEGSGTGTGRAVGRPAVARALVEAGAASDISDAFHRYLGSDAPAFVPRRGASPQEVVRRIREAGGLASLAHPGKTNRDDLLPALVEQGLAAIEVFHPDHSDADVSRYLERARALGLLVSGGSDYHGPGSGRSEGLGRVTLAETHWQALQARAGRR